MKILYIGYSQNPYYNEKTLGGLQKVERDMLRLLSDNGDEIKFLTNNDSEACTFPGVEMIYSTPSRYTEAGKALGNKRNRMRNDYIMKAIEEHQPTLIISHDDPNIALLKLMSRLTIPCIHFIHSSVYVSGGPGILGYMEALYEYSAAGHTVCCMSETSRREWADQLNRSKKHLPEKADGDTVFSTYWHPGVMWEIPELKMTEGDFVMVGRPDKFKNHKAGFAAAGDRMLLFATSPKNDAEVEIVKELQEKYQANICFDAAHHRIMSWIARCKALLICGPESFGLTALEANMHGTPVIVVSSRPHSASEVCRKSVKIVKKNELKELLTNYKSPTMEMRMDIQSATWEYYNPQSVSLRLANLLAGTIMKFGNKETNSLEAFF